MIDRYYNIVTPCFDSLAIRHCSEHKNTSSHYQLASGFEGKHKLIFFEFQKKKLTENILTSNPIKTILCRFTQLRKKLIFFLIGTSIYLIIYFLL